MFGDKFKIELKPAVREATEEEKKKADDRRKEKESKKNS